MLYLTLEQLDGNGPAKRYPWNKKSRDFFTKQGRFGYYTKSGATPQEVIAAMDDMFEWEWDDDSDGTTY